MKIFFKDKKINLDADALACFSAVLFLPSGVVLDFRENQH